MGACNGCEDSSALFDIPPRYAHFAHHLAARQIADILGRTHWIPICRGLTGEWVAQHHPGHTFNELIGVFNAAGVVGPLSSRGGPPRPIAGLFAIHFDSVESFAVELRGNDGRSSTVG